MRFLFTAVVVCVFLSLQAQVTLTLCPSGCTFSSFANMAANLSSYMAPGGVIVNVSPGTYTEKFVLGNVGASAANPVIIQSATGDSSDVLITYPSSASSANNYMIRFSGASYVTFRNMTFSRTGSQDYCIYVHLTSSANNINFESIRFIGSPYTPWVPNWSSLIFASSLGGSTSQIHHLNVNRCSFVDHPNGIYLEGSSSRYYNVSITESDFSNIDEPIYFTLLRDVNISGCSFTHFGLNLGTAITVTETEDTLNITRNYINGKYSKGIYLNTCHGAGKYSLIANNEISLINYGKGISIYGSTYKRIEHNTVLMRASGQAIDLQYFTVGASNNISVRNNIMASVGNNYELYYVLKPGVDFVSDYNLLWTLGTKLGAYDSVTALTANGIAGWQSISGQDAHSVLADPLFYSVNTLIGNSPFIAGGGTPIPYIPLDKVDTVRSSTAPYIGAYEALSGGPCAFIRVDSVQTTDVACFGASTGTIKVYGSEGTAPYLYSVGIVDTTPVLYAVETFDQNVFTTAVPYERRFSTCSSGGAASWVRSISSGCSNGNAYISGSGYNNVNCILRTPEVEALGHNSVILRFDLTNPDRSAYTDSIAFNIASSTSTINRSLVPVKVNGVPGYGLRLDQSRSCTSVEVEFDISDPTINKSNLTFMISAVCPGPNCNGFYLRVDNLEVVQGSIAGYEFRNTTTFTGLPAGSYTVLTRDANGCEVPYINNPVILGQSDSIAPNLAVNHVTLPGANDGKVWAAATGGVPPYTYAWSSGSVSGPNGDTISGLSAGIYTVTVTDNSGCSNTAQMVVTSPSCTVDITAVNISKITCQNANDASITVVTTGGAGTVQYSIDNGSSWSNNNVFQNLAAGAYTVLVRDSFGCTDAGPANPYNITNPSLFSISALPVNVTTVGGSNGSVILTATGGVPGYTYQWSNGATTRDIYNLTAGQYCVTVTDAVGCIRSTCVTVSAPNCNIAVTQVLASQAGCNGVSDGTILIATTGANGAVQYSVNNGATWSASGTFTGLLAGNYTVLVRDAAGCTASAPGNPYTIAVPYTMTASTSTGNASGSGVANGSVNLTTSGGSGTITYLWSNGAQTEDLNNVVPGTYCVTVSDALGCSLTRCDTVRFNCGLTVTSVNTQDVSCYGYSDGTITITASGGVGPLQYSVNNGATWSGGSGTISNLPPGSYTIQVRDNQGCQTAYAGNPVVVNNAAPLNPVISEQGGMLIVANGFDFYEWFLNGQLVSSGLGWNTYIPTQSGNYQVVVTNIPACSDTSAVFNFTYTGIQEVESTFRVWPNPTEDVLYFEVINSTAEGYTVDLLAVTGELLLSHKIQSGTGTLNVSDLAKGMYYLRFSGSGGVRFEKVLVQ